MTNLSDVISQSIQGLLVSMPPNGYRTYCTQASATNRIALTRMLEHSIRWWTRPNRFLRCRSNEPRNRKHRTLVWVLRRNRRGKGAMEVVQTMEVAAVAAAVAVDRWPAVLQVSPLQSTPRSKVKSCDTNRATRFVLFAWLLIYNCYWNTNKHLLSRCFYIAFAWCEIAI